MTRTTVHLLRHAEVDNPTGILYGRMPGYRLSPFGEQQAIRLAEHFAGRDIVHVMSSPLERAQQTARPIADAYQLEMMADERLTEAANAFEGSRMSFAEGGALRSPLNWIKLRNPFRPSWGEAYLDIAHRMLGAVNRARAIAAGHEAICVSHQLPIWTLRRFLTGKRLWHDPRRRECALGSVTSLTFSDEELIRIVYSEPVPSGRTGMVGA